MSWSDKDAYKPAGDLWPGDMLHVTVMGGDDYIEVESVEVSRGKKNIVRWRGCWANGGAVRDEVPIDQRVRVKLV